MKKRSKKSLREIEERLGYSFKDKKLLETGLSHKSYVNEMKDPSMEDNEKLEFLGDSVLNLVVSRQLMEQFPTLKEGVLSKKRSSIVNEKTLAKLSRKMSLGDFLLLGKGEELTDGRDKDSLLANALEAVIGAVFLDSSLEGAQGFVTRHFKNIIRYCAKPGSYKDYKTLCQEMSQKIFKRPPQYKLIGVKGPEHRKSFESEIMIGEESFGRGKGKSKKDSEQKCAKAALKRLEGML